MTVRELISELRTRFKQDATVYVDVDLDELGWDRDDTDAAMLDVSHIEDRGQTPQIAVLCLEALPELDDDEEA